MAQTHPAVPLVDQALSATLSDLSNALAAYLTSFSGASAPTSPAPANGRLWYDTTNHTLNIYISSTWQTLLTKALANIGTTTKANATGDLAAGITGGTSMSWDVATQTLTIYDGSDIAVAQVVATADGGRLILLDDSSVERVRLDSDNGSGAAIGTWKDASGNTRVMITSSGDGEVEVGPTSGAPKIRVTDTALGVYDGSGALQHTIGGASDVEFNVTLADRDTVIYGDTREVARVDAGLDALVVTQLNYGAPEAKTIASGVIVPTKTRVRITSEGGSGADNLDGMNPANLADGNAYLLTSASGSTVTVKHNTAPGSGKKFLIGSDRVLDNVADTLAVIYDATADAFCITGFGSGA